MNYYKNAFKPGKIGSMETKNRFVVPAMETLYSEDGTINQKVIDYWVERAKGGWGLLTVEVAAICPSGKGFPNALTLYDEECIPGYKKLVDEVHKYGAKISIQLHHAGRQTSSAYTGEPIVAPSPIASWMYGEIPKELTTEEAYEIIEKYGDAAVIAKKAGFDAVEVHSAHGYLPQQFMSPSSNKRTDEFGGDLEARNKFAVEIVKNIKKKAGQDYPVTIRISSDEFLADGMTLEDAQLSAILLEAAGVDAINVSLSTAATQQWCAAPMSVMPGFNLNSVEAIKKKVGIPVMAVGKINEPYLIENALTSEKTDFISIGRGSIADPYLPQKMASGDIDEISPCISCNQRCLVGPASDVTSMACLVNPFTGREKELEIKDAEASKNIVVVGAGPAGLEFAWIAAKRGHKVTVLEKETVAGGQFYLAAIPPTKQPIAKAIKYYMHMGKKYGVTYQFGIEANESVIKGLNPDEVVLETGGQPIVLNLDGINGEKVVSLDDVLRGKLKPGKSVLVVGGGSSGAETADYLAENMHQVTIIEMADAIAKDEPYSARLFLLERLNKFGVKTIVGAKVKSFLYDGVTYEKEGMEQTIEGFDTIILAMGTKSYNPLEKSLNNTVREIHVIGDASKARNAGFSIEEAARLAVKI